MMAVEFTEKSAEKIARATRTVLANSARGLSDSVFGEGNQTFIEGELVSDCTAPTSSDPTVVPDGKKNATKCTAQRWVPIPGDTHDPPWYQLDSTYTYNLVNRSKNLVAKSGTYCIWVRVGNEWRIVWADC